MDVSTDSKIRCLRVKEVVLVANPVLFFVQILVFLSSFMFTAIVC
jgi:hypothetical protein